MKKLIYLILLTFAVTSIVSCGGKNEGKTALREMEKIVEKAEKDKDKLTAEEWKELAVEFEKNEKIASEAADNDKLGIAGNMKLLSLTARWATAYGPRMMQDMLPNLSEPLENLGSDLQKLMDALQEDSIMEEALAEDMKDQDRE